MTVQCSLYVASAGEVEEFRRRGWIPDEWLLDLGEDQILDLGQDWELICAALDEPPPAGAAAQALLGGDPVGRDYTGFGPARLISDRQVAEFADALERFDEERFRSRVAESDLGVVAGLATDTDALDAVVALYARLVAAYRRAADQAKSVIVWNH